MNILFIADIVGKPGRRILKDKLPKLMRQESIDFVIANGENAAGGFGLNNKIKDELFDYGINVLTTGNHVWDNKEIFQFIDKDERVIRGANLPATHGNVVYTQKVGNKKISVFSLIGRVFMGSYSLSDCPFIKGMELAEKLAGESDIIIVDIHAETTSEKKALGYYLDGKVTAVIGTHTHISTNDLMILPSGTAYMTDSGMTGPIDSVIGVSKEIIINKYLTCMPHRFEVASGQAQLEAVVIKTNNENKAEEVKRIYLKEDESKEA